MQLYLITMLYTCQHAIFTACRTRHVGRLGPWGRRDYILCKQMLFLVQTYLSSESVFQASSMLDFTFLYLSGRALRRSLGGFFL